MTNSVRKVAQAVRHAPGLEGADWLWSLLRRPYQRVVDLRGRGVEVRVGDYQTVRMPAEYTAGSWESYEPEAVKALVDWLGVNPDAVVLDVGCAVGIFSAISLFASPTAEAIAIDSDLSSLKATQRLCRYAPADRLRVIQGLVAAEHGSGWNLDEACEETLKVLALRGVTGDVGTTAYICLDGDEEGIIPRHSLDGLLSTVDLGGRPLLLKCDIEGAEMLLLLGARGLIARNSPTMLLSIHPEALPAYGHTREMVADFLAGHGYKVEVLSIDHEEHWWCLPPDRS